MSARDNAHSAPPSGLSPSPRTSAAPLLSESKPEDDAPDQSSLLAKGKRKLLGLGKKKEGEKKDTDKQQQANTSQTARPAMSPTSAPSLAASPPLSSLARPVSPLGSPPADRRPSPRGSPRIYPASPNRRLNRSTSPGLHSPASSQIFERNVQENTVPGELSPAIPSHIQTEDHIPPVLEASSLAITDDHLNPDEVEIVMHSAHQPAAVAVASSMTDSLHSPSHDDFISHQDVDDSASNYGSLDTTDVRRLSFISFADVVQAEHVESNRDAMQFMSLSTAANRSPSPVRSPASSHGFSVSPPTSGATSVKGAELVSPMSGLSPSSPTAAHGTHSPPLGGELQIETMRQALRKTGSGDLSGARSQSQPLNAGVADDSNATTQLPLFK